jgi:hypothetical protein
MKLNYFNILIEKSSDAEVSRHFARGSIVSHIGSLASFVSGVE